MGGRLTTHVLDLSTGIPASGIALQLWRINDVGRELLREAKTNGDGRLDAPLLEGMTMEPGTYELLFMAGSYFRSKASEGPAPEGENVTSFLEHIPIRFNIASSEEHYHVPLLVAPGGYSTYRGS